ncbi:glycosyltransferase family 4 protein [Uliginosibacterium sp. H3]|uniref:Glycosyltransferase family 4 protein n=1 Tax=Uliginosibacterium silvisoli TaxID=3114758 RepID=A0ABU6K8B2_9RHOO|nr:glycosyltransferase family 4 protein [Uliginosibacterium sp. H3]
MKIVLFANTDWFLYNFKLSLAKALRARGDEVVLLSPPGEYGPRLREMGFRWEPLPVSRSGINPLAELAAIRRVEALYRDVRPDVVHHFTIKCVIYGSLAARRVGIRRIVNSVTGLGFALLADTLKARCIRPVVLALYRLALRNTQVVFQNADNRDTLAAKGVLARSKVHVIAGDGVDSAYFVPPQSEGQQLVVLMMARLLYPKGIREFVEAARRVRSTMPQVRFLLAGEPDPGNPESVDAATLAAWKAEGVVEFLGHRSDVLALNQTCSVAVLASTQGEGIPRSLLEAAACRRALVATNVPGCRALVVDGQTGLLVPPCDSGALSEAILRLLKDAALRARLGLAARELVEQRFSDQCITGQTFAVYDAAANA